MRTAQRRREALPLLLLLLLLLAPQLLLAGKTCLAPGRGWSLSGVATPGARRPMWRTSGLTLCNRFAQKTCCARAQTDALYLQWRATAQAGFAPQCSAMFETALCMECDPRVGTGSVRQVCKRTCDAWLDACRGEYFEAQTVAGLALEPCREDSLLCSPLDAFVDSGAELCARFGLHVGEEFCYDGAADPSAFGEKERAPPTHHRHDMRPWYEQWLLDLPRPALYAAAVATAAAVALPVALSRRMTGGDSEPAGQRLGGDAAASVLLRRPHEEE